MGGWFLGLIGVALCVPSRATYRSEPLRRRSLVREATECLVLSGLFLVIRICWTFGGGGRDVLEFLFLVFFEFAKSSVELEGFMLGDTPFSSDWEECGSEPRLCR